MYELFARETVMRAWLRAGSRCECRRMAHGHAGRCNRQLVWSNRGRDTRDAWEVDARGNRSDSSLSNCEILCRNAICACTAPATSAFTQDRLFHTGTEQLTASSFIPTGRPEISP